jgi:hypothetical protein
MNRFYALALAISVFSPISPALADNGMWYIGVDMCNTDRSNCTKGLMTQDDAYSYVSKTECEQEEQTFLNYMQNRGMVVNRVWCEQQ